MCLHEYRGCMVEMSLYQGSVSRKCCFIVIPVLLQQRQPRLTHVKNVPGTLRTFNFAEAELCRGRSTNNGS